MLGQAGFFVPASHANLVWSGGMFVSIGERSQADQTEGRLGSELVRIRNVFEHARVGSFVLVDELCSGTNPEEGQEIFTMVLDLMQQLHLQSVVSTHFLELARELQRSPRALSLAFLRVVVDDDNRPTYQFAPGVAASSLAHHTAARLGVTREELYDLVLKRRREAGAVAPATPRPPATPLAGRVG